MTDPILGWVMALIALGADWLGYGWPVIAPAVSVTAFWLMIQFNRSLKVMRNAASAPIGHIDSAVMLNAKLRTALPMLQVIPLTRSLSLHVAEDPQIWACADAAGSEVRIVFDTGRRQSWVLNRPAA